MNKEIEIVNLQLDKIQSNVLVVHLFEYMQDNILKTNNLINKKFELIEKILFARFGFKSSWLGFEKKEPYFSKSHWPIVLEIKELNLIINKRSFSNKYLDQIYINISSLTNFNPESPYQSRAVIENKKW